MSWSEGDLASCFEGVAIKKLSAVEADVKASHQHEFNATRKILEIFGKPDDALKIDTHFFYLGNDAHIESKGSLTLYDARAKARIERGVMRSEFRLYFADNDVTLQMKEGDGLIIAKRTNGSAVIVILQSNSTIASQILWLFGVDINTIENSFEVHDKERLKNTPVPYSVSWLLDILGVKLPETDDYLDDMISLFGGFFPDTKTFSQYARSKSIYNDGRCDTADKIIADWVNTEARLFLTYEQYLLKLDIESGLTPDSFISKAKSYLNRRKSRAGQSLENHLEHLFIERKIPYSRTPRTEGNSRPDFIFPSIEAYRDENFPSVGLHMLGVKTTCKDRWRQVLVEAARIPAKHLLTLEPSISEMQTNEMIAHKLQLVIPESIRSSYTPFQQSWLMNIESFIEILR